MSVPLSLLLLSVLPVLLLYLLHYIGDTVHFSILVIITYLVVDDKYVVVGSQLTKIVRERKGREAGRQIKKEKGGRPAVLRSCGLLVNEKKR